MDFFIIKRIKLLSQIKSRTAFALNILTKYSITNKSRQLKQGSARS